VESQEDERKEIIKLQKKVTFLDKEVWKGKML
jgi:hypothetical protein